MNHSGSGFRHCIRGGFVVAAISALTAFSSAQASEGIDFSNRILLAGKAKIEGEGYVIARNLGKANFSPDLSFPVELVYDSSNEKCGLFGFAWRSPQLESSVGWDKDGMLWVSPWGEKIKFFAKSDKTPKDAIKLDVIEQAKRGRGYFAPYSNWQADVVSGNAESSGNWAIVGRGEKAGWRFNYVDCKLASIVAPNGDGVEFRYDGSSRISIIEKGVAFIDIVCKDGIAESVAVNGVKYSLTYAERELEILPHVANGPIAHPHRMVLTSMRRGSLAPECYGYRGNYLESVKRGGFVETIDFAIEGRVANIVSDNEFDYSRIGNGVSLVDRMGRRASYSYDSGAGSFKITDFSGRKYEIFYFMRYDVAYIGKVRRIVDGNGNELAGYRYDSKSGKVTRVRDRFGNDRNFEYDDSGRLARITRRAFGERKVENIASFKYAGGSKPIAIETLNDDGSIANTVKISYDGSARPIAVDDGLGRKTIAYNRFGYPVEIKNALGIATSICYNEFNVPESMVDGDGIVTVFAYNDAGLTASVTRRCGDETVSSLSFSYDGTGRPISFADQDGRRYSFDLDAFGRVIKQFAPDGTSVSYTYDKLGRRTSVTDENGHRIGFEYDRFGISRRTTAVGQLTDFVRDADGSVAEIVSSQSGREDRRISRKSDEFDRPVRVDYGNGEVESFAYDKWGRLAKHSRGKLAESYAYDHFGRLVSKNSADGRTVYAYDSFGNRVLRADFDAKGTEISRERREYDSFGRLVEISSFGSVVRYAYDAKGRVSRQTIDGSPIEYSYTKLGQLAGKYLGGRQNCDAAVEYEYSRSGKLIARIANGERHEFIYDAKGQLVAVKGPDGAELERYAYDKAGNMIAKTVGGKTTKFVFDGANQLMSSTSDGVTKFYAYDAAGRLVKEGDRTYAYGYLDKVMSVKDGDRFFTYTYYPDGQLRSADYGERSESFAWDGLALVKRGDERFINEPHVGGGNPVASSKGGLYFNDMLGTTVGVKNGGKYSAAALTAFGEDIGQTGSGAFFTGKPQVEGLGRVFWMRNYRASLGKWQTADPMGYPDGWNQLAYCNNGVTDCVDLWGCEVSIFCDPGCHQIFSHVYKRVLWHDPGSSLIMSDLPSNNNGSWGADDIRKAIERIRGVSGVYILPIEYWLVEDGWELISETPERKEGDYYYHEEIWQKWEINDAYQYAMVPKDDFIDSVLGSIGSDLNDIGRALTFIGMVCPSLSLPPIVGGCLELGEILANELKGPGVKVLLDYWREPKKYTGDFKRDFYHRWIEE